MQISSHTRCIGTAVLASALERAVVKCTFDRIASSICRTRKASLRDELVRAVVDQLRGRIFSRIHRTRIGCLRNNLGRAFLNRFSN